MIVLTISNNAISLYLKYGDIIVAGNIDYIPYYYLKLLNKVSRQQDISICDIVLKRLLSRQPNCSNLM